MYNLVSNLPFAVYLFLAFLAGVLWMLLLANGQGAFRKDLLFRHKRFFISMISKKLFAWWVGTFAFFADKLPPEYWVGLTAAVFCLDLVQKYKGLDPTIPKAEQGYPAVETAG